MRTTSDASVKGYGCICAFNFHDVRKSRLRGAELLSEHRCDTAAEHSIGVILFANVTSFKFPALITIGMLTWSLLVITYVLMRCPLMVSTGCDAMSIRTRTNAYMERRACVPAGPMCSYHACG